jgi:hypothetical protein
MQALLLFAAALIVAELLHRSDDDLGTDDEADRFSAAAPVAVAAAILLGPWSALAVAAPAVGAVRLLQGAGWRESAVRAFSLGGGAFAGGYAYLLASDTGSVALPDDLMALVLLGIAFTGVKTLLVRLPTRAMAFEPDPLPAGAEVALGAAVALAVDVNLWNAALLVPALVLIEHLYGRTLALRREVASALETFANLVDERDRSTFRHSQRVADSVRDFAHALGLPRADVQRMWWAGRLHDLGKVAVDAAALRKTGLLNIYDWEAVRRAPRLSARLLQRFRFAAQQAKAVEYHRERYDGSGYYGAKGAAVPLAAHMLIVADAYDAMISERPFRPSLSKEEALLEIEQNAGSQFHPGIARAFVALQRGQRPADVLRAEDVASIREASAPAAARPSLRRLGQRPELLALLGVAVSLVGLGISIVEVALAGAGVSALGLVVWCFSRLRARRLGRRIDAALERSGDRSALFFALTEAFEHAWAQAYTTLVAWHDHGTDGTIELAHGASGVPDAELTSWLLREAESRDDVIVDDGTELGRTGASLALPLRRENSELVGFLVLGSDGRLPRHLVAACHSCVDRIGLALADAPPAASDEPYIALVAQ